MSVRIYQLSKELNMTNKEIITLLQEKGLEVNSPSNTIPNIYAEAFREEFGKNKGTTPAPVPTPETKKAPEHTPIPQNTKLLQACLKNLNLSKQQMISKMKKGNSKKANLK